MLVVVLTVTTGGVDAAAFLHLGHVFSSVITGTMVLLGVAAGTHDAVLAENCAVALASYVAGVAVGAPLAARRTGRWLEGWPGRRSHTATTRREIWPSWLTVALGLEFCVLVVFSRGLGAVRRPPIRGRPADAAGQRGLGHGHPGRDRPPAGRGVHHLPDRDADRGDRRAGHRAQAQRPGAQPRDLRGPGRGGVRFRRRHDLRARAAPARGAGPAGPGRVGRLRPVRAQARLAGSPGSLVLAVQLPPGVRAELSLRTPGPSAGIRGAPPRV